MTADDANYLMETLKAATPWYVFTHYASLVDRFMIVASVICAGCAVAIAVRNPSADGRAYATAARCRWIAIATALFGAAYIAVDTWAFYGFVRAYAPPGQRSPIHILLPPALSIAYTLLVAGIVWLLATWAVKRVRARIEAVMQSLF